jgi:hypothetical protein
MTRLSRFALALAAASLALALPSCARAPLSGGWRPAPAGRPQVQRATRGETWTLLVHLAADNDLYDFGLGDLNEMEAALPRDGSLEVLVLFDGLDEGDSAVYRIRRDPGGYNDTIVSEQLAVPAVVPPSGEIDSGDRATVQRFLQWGAREARGQRLMLTFWDHGSGLFRRAGAGLMPLGFGYDDNGSNLTTADLRGLCAAVAGVRGRPADIVSFDACLMGHGELAYQIEGLGDLFIASEHLIPGTGWDYEGWFERWERLGSRAPLAVSNALVDAFAASYALDRKDVTLSVVDVAAFNSQVVPALDAFVAAAVRALPAHKKALQQSRERAMRFYNRDCADLGSFLANVEKLVPAPDVAKAASDTRAALSRAVLREHHTRPMFEGATGAVLYFPEPGQRYSAEYDRPERVRFAERSWRQFLKAYR